MQKNLAHPNTKYSTQNNCKDVTELFFLVPLNSLARNSHEDLNFIIAPKFIEVGLHFENLSANSHSS